MPIPQEIRNKKIESASKPGSVVILPRTPEGRVMTVMTWRLAKLLSLAKRRAYVYVSVEEVVDAFQRVKEFNDRLETFVSENFPEALHPSISVFESDLKTKLAGNDRSFVFDPEILPEESIRAAKLVKALDSALVGLRAKIDKEPEKCTEILRGVAELCVEARRLTDYVSRRVINTPFEIRGRNGRIYKNILRNFGLSDDGVEGDGDKEGASDTDADTSSPYI